MAIAFTTGGIAYWLLGSARHDALDFCHLRGADLLHLGLDFQSFPSTCTDMFGAKYATTNTSLLYTAKGLSAFVVPSRTC